MNRTHLLAVSASLLLVNAAPHALAQNALGDGRALDNNTRVGDSRINTRLPALSERLRINDAIATGNAAFGRSFRGELGYTEAGAFRGELGSNDLFSFRRDTAQTALYGAGIRATDALEYQFSLATGSAPPSVLSLRGSGAVERFGTAINPQDFNDGSLRSTAGYLASQSIRPALLTYLRVEDRTYALTASPLTGVRRVALPTTALEEPRIDTTVAPTDFRTEATTDYSIERRNEREAATTLLNGLEGSVRGTGQVLAVSSQLEQAAINDRIDPRSPVYETVLEQLTEDTETGDGDAPPPDLLDRLRSRLRGEFGPIEETDPSRPAAPETDPDANADDEAAINDAVIEAVEGAPILTDEDREWINLDPALAGMDPNLLRALRDSRVLIDTLAKTEPTAGARVTATYLRHMDSAQRLLGDGRYFDAEDRFIRAMAAKPGDVMASVGRIHSQLGGGLYLSAGANLRKLLTEHPELLMVVYDEKLLPKRSRSERIIEQLSESLDSDRSGLGSDAALLLAYVAHHIGDETAVKYALDRLDDETDASQVGPTGLVALLKTVWGPQADDEPQP